MQRLAYKHSSAILPLYPTPIVVTLTLVVLLYAACNVTTALALAPDDSVKISEVHYDPPEMPQETHEFIELFNAGSTTVYLDGAVITDEGNAGGNEATFQFPGVPGGTSIALTAGAYLLLVPDATGSSYANIDYEFYAGGGDSDDLGVPNLLKTSGLATELILGNSGDGVTLSSGISNGNVIPCNEIVDGISWESGGVGDTTALSDSVCSDPAPLNASTNTYSLQRCPSGQDTDSDTDFLIRLRTPGTANACPAPPTFLWRTHSPCMPLENDPVTVSAYWIDTNDNLQEVWIYFRNAAVSSFDSLQMNAVGDSLFEATLPGDLDQSIIEYYFTALDSTAFVTTWPPTGLASYRVGLSDIVDIQSMAAADSCASSLLLGQPVNITGVVSHIAREFSDFYFYIQQGTAPYSGMRVFVEDGSFIPNYRDSVFVVGMVAEYMCQTQVEAITGCVGLLRSGADVTPRLLNTIQEVELEENESMLVTIPGPIDVLSGFLGETIDGVEYLEFAAGPASDPIWVGTDTFEPDSIRYTPDPHVGLQLDALTGIVALRESFLSAEPTTRLRLEPRRDNDVNVTYTSAIPQPVQQFRLPPNRPNPFNPNTTVYFELPDAARVDVDVFDIAGQHVRTLRNARQFPAGRHRVLWNGRNGRGVAMPSGVYLVLVRADGQGISRKIHLLR